MNRLDKKNLQSSKIFACIFARGGSKGVKRKNIKILGGKPLIAYAIESGLGNDFIDDVFVSTDDEEIAEIASQYGAKVPFIRPKNLATDEAPMWRVWQHIMSFFKDEGCLPEIMIDLPCTSPFRSNNDINHCLLKLINEDFDAVITITESKRHPMFNMVTMDTEGKLDLLMNSNDIITRRQEAPTAFDITTVAYAVKTEYIFNSTNLFDGKIGAIEIPEERSLDIDTEFDFNLAKKIIKK